MNRFKHELNEFFIHNQMANGQSSSRLDQFVSNNAIHDHTN